MNASTNRCDRQRALRRLLTRSAGGPAGVRRRRRPGLAGVAAAIVAFGLMAGPGLAQDRRPMPLVPQYPGAPAAIPDAASGSGGPRWTETPTVTVPSGSTGRPAVEVNEPGHAPGLRPPPPARTGHAGPSARPVPGGPPIHTQVLEALDSDGLGLLDGANGGFGLAMWQGSARGMVRAGLTHLPVSAPSRAVHDLARRLLASIAPPPPPPDRRPADPLLPIRLEKLAVMGETATLAQMAAMLPQNKGGERVMRAGVDGLFVEGDTATACNTVAEANRAYQDVYWRKAFVFCQMLAGNRDVALSGLDLLREQGEKDPLFQAGIDDLAGLTRLSLKSAAGATPLHLAVLRETRQPLPRDIVKTDSLAVQKAVAGLAGMDMDLRLAAAERAETAGALDTAALRALYAQVDGGSAKPKGAADAGARDRALAYQAVVATADPEARAAAITRALEQAAGDGTTSMLLARVLAPAIEEMTPLSGLAGFAPTAVRALCAAGRSEKATGWLAVAEPAAGGGAATRGLEPLLRLLFPERGPPWSTELLVAWRAAQEQAGVTGPALADRQRMLVSLFDALGEPVDNADWAKLLDETAPRPARLPPLPVWHGLAEAAEAGRRGETVMLAIAALGGEAPAVADPAVIHRVVSGLRLVGLEDDARAIAVEVLIGRGL